MNSTLQTILAVVAGIVVGGIINSVLVQMGPSLIPLPEGVDPMDMDSIKSNIHLYQPKHFMVPFVAHALGVLVGAYIAARFSANNHRRAALIIGGFFLIGGITAVQMFGGPTWFIVLDLVVAYFPMAWLGWYFTGKPVA